MKLAYLFFTGSTSNESFIHFSYSVLFYWIREFATLILVFTVYYVGVWWQLDSCVYSGHFWQLYTTWRRPATVSIQWWLKLNHYNYLHMVSAWIGEWWCVYDTFKSKIYTLICFHRNCKLHLSTTMLSASVSAVSVPWQGQAKLVLGTRSRGRNNYQNEWNQGKNKCHQ